MTKIKQIATGALEDLKGKDIVSVDVSKISDAMDALLICTGSSNRQVKSLANNVVDEGKKAGFRPLGVEGMEEGEWVLVDYGDLVVHVMQSETRKFYDLEKLWSMSPVLRNASQSAQFKED